MALKDTIEKLKGMDGVNEAEIAELTALMDVPKKDEKSEKELKEAKAAQARILEEKKKLQEKIAEQESAMEELKNGGLSESDKTQKEMEKLLKAKEKTGQTLPQLVRPVLVVHLDQQI